MLRLVLAGAAIALLAGCGGGSTNPFPNAKRVGVTVSASGFSPATVNAARGDSIVFTAADDHHAVTFFGSNLPANCCQSSGNLNTGQSSPAVIFIKSGSFQFRDDSIPAHTGVANIQ